ncbi:MAG TPA: ankyrin repeat domain-containing protein, partial [Gammaproteobacteria bacterium]|nr:ankyrin repeat domain-containing protein [Gammaproteobacteria bacterium]
MVNQSISKEILFGTFDSVLKCVRGGSDVNEKDVYGLTPLIEATLKKDVRIAELLLEHGAKINQEDISGQTALQWAVNRYHVPLCELFLKHKADPNHYSADGQPLLVNPILREQKDIIQLLVSFGAELTFAFDFINAKLIGHRYELMGRARILNPDNAFIDLSYEGFFLEFTVGIIYRTLQNFINSSANNQFNAYAAVLSKVARTLKVASQIIPYKYTTEVSKDQDAVIRRALTDDLVVIPVSYEGHAITFIKHGKLFAKCDRGVQHIVDTVVISEVGNPIALNADFLKDLMYNNKSDEYINKDIKTILGLKPLTTLPARYQLSGNCSWANVEASVPAMMFMLMFRGNLESRGEIAALKKSIMQYYDTWVNWDKDRILSECIESFYNANKEKKAAKASILAAILFQRCRASHKNEIERAKKILSILTLPEYNYILKTYIKVYYTRMAGKLGEDFLGVLRACGLDMN